MRGGLFWSREAMIAAGHAWELEHGRPPTSVEWRRATPQHPADTTVRHRFGSWNAFMVECGWKGRPAHRLPVWTRREIHDAVYRWRLQHGRNPRYRDWHLRSSVEWPSATTVISVFGSWNWMLEAGGFGVNQSSPGGVRVDAVNRRRAYRREWDKRRRERLAA